MLFLTTYTVKPHLTAQDTKRLLEEFAKHGDVPGTLAHYALLSGGGVVISNNEDAVDLYRSLIRYGEYLEFNVTPALRMEDAIAPLLEQAAETP